MGLAEPWLKPISDAAPAGVDATYDARYVTVTAWLTELDSPASGRLDRARVWGSVEAAGRELLVEVTKDLTMAAYVAHAMYQLQGAIGLVRGLALFTGLVERFWPAMFPEVKRVKRRANALAWYVERTAAALEAAPPTAGERDALERALTLLDRLIASTRERMGDATPPFAPLRDALRRRALDAARGA
jgi:type VI secretion system protein VasJ